MTCCSRFLPVPVHEEADRFKYEKNDHGPDEQMQESPEVKSGEKATRTTEPISVEIIVHNDLPPSYR